MNRNNKILENLPDIIDHLSKGDFHECTWVGQNYSKADLINDLNKIQNKPWYKKTGDFICKHFHR